MLRKLLLHNLSVKIAAFFLALILWAYVTGDSLPVEEQPNIRRSYTNVALEWLNLDDELAITKITEEVDVVLNGNKDVLDEITPGHCVFLLICATLARADTVLLP